MMTKKLEGSPSKEIILIIFKYLMIKKLCCNTRIDLLSYLVEDEISGDKAHLELVSY